MADKPKKGKKSFKSFNPKNIIDVKPTLDEAVKKTAVISFGRMNPITIGHEKLVGKVTTEARMRKGTPMIFLTHSEDAKKNPLSYNDKIKFAQKAFGKIVVKSPARTIIEVTKYLTGKYSNLVMVVGSDRIKEFESLLNKYNNKEFKFDNIEVVSSGDRDPDAEGVTGMSGTKMRELASKNDITAFTKGLPNRLKPNAKQVLLAVRKGMNMSEENIVEEQELDEALSRMARRKRSIAARRARFRMKRGRERAKKRVASLDVLKRRARKAAIKFFKKRFTKGRNYNTMSAGEKEIIDKRVEKISKKRLDQIARKLLPKIKRKELDRRKAMMARQTKNEEVHLEEASKADTRVRKRPHMMMDSKGAVKFDGRFKIYKKKTVNESVEDEVVDLMESTEAFANSVSPEQIDELSKEKLAGYEKKARTSAIVNALKFGKKAHDKYKKREAGLKKASKKTGTQYSNAWRHESNASGEKNLELDRERAAKAKLKPNDRAKIDAIKSMMKHANEETQIDELSNDLLQRYDDAKEKKHRQPDGSTKYKSVHQSLKRTVGGIRSLKRQAGFKAPTNKVSRADHFAAYGKDGHKVVAKHNKKVARESVEYDLNEDAKVIAHLVKKGLNPKDAAASTKKHLPYVKKAYGNLSPAQAAAKVSMARANEEKQIDELSKDTLKSYRKKADKSAVDSLTSNDPKQKLKYGKRLTGMGRATKRLNKEEKQIDELSKDTLMKYSDAASKDLMKAVHGDKTSNIYKVNKTSKSGKPLTVQGIRRRQNKKFDRRTSQSGDAYRKAQAMESVEQIDELSKDTLGSYIGKATDDKKAWKDTRKAFAKKGYKDHGFENSKIAKRNTGIKKAASRLTKEDTQFDESIHHDIDHSDPDFKRLLKKHNVTHSVVKRGPQSGDSIKLHGDKKNVQHVSKVLRNPEQHQNEAWSPLSKGTQDHIADVQQKRANDLKKLRDAKRAKNPTFMDKFKKGFKKEDTEQLDELNPSTLGRYSRAAARDVGITSDHKRIKKRLKGIDNATHKLAMKAIRGGVRESKVPFDPPYKKVKSGTTIDKSGAKHTPMSKARHLAQMAIKQAMDKKQKKEDVNEATWSVDVAGMPKFYVDGKSQGDVKKELRKLIKSDKIKEIIVKRVQPIEVRKDFRQRSQDPSGKAETEE